MSGGNFDINSPKVRPGDYINYKAKQKYSVSTSTRGTCVIPLIGYDWAEDKSWIEISADAPDAQIVKLGRSIYDDNKFMRMIRLAMENAVTAKVYVISGGTKAKVENESVTITALYAGELGNQITVTSVENVDGGFDVKIYLAGELVETIEGAKSIDELTAAGSNYVTFSGTGELSAFAGAVLTGGAPAETTNSAVTDFYDRIEKVSFDTALIPVSDEALVQAAVSKVKFLRTKVGKTVQFVIPKCEGDHEGVIGIWNSFVFDEKDMSLDEAAAWFTGATAGASNTQSNTYKVVSGATAVVGELTNEEAEKAILSGHTFFSTSDDTGEVIVEYDINSLVNTGTEKDNSYKKNRVIRVLDSFANDLKSTFPPNKFDNDPDGWKIMEGLGKDLLKQYGPKSDNGVGAIKNIDYDNDFLVDTSRSSGDSTYFNVAIQPVDSAEKLYFSISTQ
jgi:hypothetical protein